MERGTCTFGGEGVFIKNPGVGSTMCPFPFVELLYILNFNKLPVHVTAACFPADTFRGARVGCGLWDDGARVVLPAPDGPGEHTAPAAQERRHAPGNPPGGLRVRVHSLLHAGEEPGEDLARAVQLDQRGDLQGWHRRPPRALRGEAGAVHRRGNRRGDPREAAQQRPTAAPQKGLPQHIAGGPDPLQALARARR